MSRYIHYFQLYIYFFVVFISSEYSYELNFKI